MPKKGRQSRKPSSPPSPRSQPPLSSRSQRLSRITPAPAPELRTQYDLNNHVMENLDINQDIVNIYYEKIKELSSLTGRSETLAESSQSRKFEVVRPDTDAYRTQPTSRGGNPKKTKNKRNKRNKRKTNKRRHK